MRLCEAITLYHEHLAGYARKSTRKAAQSRLGLFQEWAAGRGIEYLWQLTPELLDGWPKAMQSQGRLYADHPYRNPVEKALSQHTIANRIRAVKAFLNWCYEREYIDRPAARWLKQPYLDHSAGNRLMRPADLQLMLAEADRRMGQQHSRDLAILMFAADTAARRGEIASLVIDNLHLHKLDALVDGKTGLRLVDFTQDTADVLQLWLSERPACDHQAVFVAMNPRKEGHKPLTHDGIYQIFRRLAKAAGVRGRFNPQALRHLVGQTWCDHVNLELVRQKLGHRSITTTSMFYSHQDRGRVKAATQLYSHTAMYKFHEEV